MRIALIADIHGNAVALEAVLTAITDQKIEHVICLGDVAATGPQPQQVLELLKATGCPVVMGNADAWLLNPQAEDNITDELTQRLRDIDLWCAQQLSPADQEYVQTFQPTIEHTLPNGRVLLCFHGSPHSFNEIILTTTPEAELERALTGFHAAIMAGGHTHIQMFRRYKDIILLNPGSVGLPIDRLSPMEEVRNPSWAEYAIVCAESDSLRVELHRVSFDLNILIQAALKSGMPHAEWWASEWSEMQGTL